MKKITALLLTIIISALALVGCDAPSDVPTGMQLVQGGESLGYYLYAPDGWIVSSQGNIAAAYVSTIDTTSVTLTEAKMPSGTVAEYFDAARADFTFDINVTKENADFKLGNAEEAKQFIYDYEYSGYKFRTMQVFAKFDGSFYIFTFTSQLSERNNGESYYDYHLNNDLTSITDNIKFVKKSGETEKVEYPESDGYLLVSKRELCGFDLYVTKNYSVDYSDGIVSVTRDDGANITVSKTVNAGTGIENYWEARERELKEIFGTITRIGDDGDDETPFGKTTTLGNLTTAAFYEYTYEHDGVTYHVYQVFAVKYILEPIWGDGYAFTFTAPEAVYADRIDEALDIAARINF